MTLNFAFWKIRGSGNRNLQGSHKKSFLIRGYCCTRAFIGYSPGTQSNRTLQITCEHQNTQCGLGEALLWTTSSSVLPLPANPSRFISCSYWFFFFFPKDLLRKICLVTPKIFLGELWVVVKGRWLQGTITQTMSQTGRVFPNLTMTRTVGSQEFRLQVSHLCRYHLTICMKTSYLQ